MHQSYNTTQLSLIKDTTKARSKGFRHRGVTGDITEELLRNSLNESLANVVIKSGTVTTRKKRKHDYDKDELSSQCDIVITPTQPWSEFCDYILVPTYDTICVIEVKYWVAPNNFESGNNDYHAQIDKLKQETESPVYLVAFHNSGDREAIMSNSNADETFIFATGSSKTPAKKMIYDGEYERLVDTINADLDDWAN